MPTKSGLVLFLAIWSLATSVSFAAWDGSATTPPSSDTTFGCYNGPVYHISTPEQLAGFAKIVNTVDSSQTGSQTRDYIAVLDNDIVFGDDTSSVSEHPWVPIGNAELFVKPIYFDGQDHVIYGLNFAPKSDSAFGLFGFMSGATLKNVTIANFKATIEADSTPVSEYLYGGSLVGRASGSLIHNAHSRGGLIQTVDAPLFHDRDLEVGGIAGSFSGTIDSSTNASDIEIEWDNLNRVGGVIGAASARYVHTNDSILHCFNSGRITLKGKYYEQREVGGIVGYAVMPVSRSRNTGTISAEYGIVGGIIGYGHDGSVTADHCENLGTILSVRSNAGGIAGYGVSVSNSVNLGDVEGSRAGGINGEAGSVELSINEGNVKGKLAGGISGINIITVTQSINRGQVSGDSAGGICGNNSGTIISSYSYTASVSATDLAGGIAAVNQGSIYTSAFDSTLLPSVDLVALNERGEVIESFALSTKEMQAIEFADKLNEAWRDYGKKSSLYEESRYRRLDWSYDGGYPRYSDSTHLPVFRIDFNDSLFVSYGLTDYEGHLVDLPPAYSSKDRYFEGWYDSTGKAVSKTTVFTGPQTIYAKYSKTIKDSSLIVYRKDSTIVGWNGEFVVPELRMHMDSSLYLVISTPAELAWYLSKGALFTPRAVLLNDIVMGKDTMSVMDRELPLMYEFGRYIDRIFDGNNHKIYGLNNALFETNYGEIRNVHLVNSFIRNKSAAFVKTNRGMILKSSLRRAVLDESDYKNGASGFADLNFDSAVIDSCVNYSDFDVSSGNFSYISGFVNTNDGIIRNSRNVGNITAADSNVAGLGISGIAMKNSQKGQILYCTNEGNIEYESTTSGSIAGISSENNGEIKGSKNYGNFKVRLLEGQGVDMAGIVASRGSVDSCANYGEITAVATEKFEFRSRMAVGGVVSEGSAVWNSLNKGPVSFIDSSLSESNSVVLGGLAADARVYSSRNEADVKWVLADSSKGLRGTKKIAVGGIVGYTHFVDNCVNDGNVAGYGFVGGIAASAGGIVFNPVDTLARVVNRGRIEAYAGGWTTYAGGICGQCVYVEKALNFGSVSAKKLNDSSWISMGGIAGYGGGAYMVANTAPVQGRGQGSRVVAGGLFGYFASLGVGLSDAYNWGEVSADSLAGGVWGIYEGELLVQDRTVSSDLNDYVRNIYNAAPVNASNGYPVGTALSCPDTVDTSYTALIYNDSAFSHDRSCVSLEDFDDNENLITFYVYTSPLSTKYMQSDAFVDLLNTSGNTTADRHVWKRSQTYPVFDEAALEMSVGSKPLESSSSSGTVASSSSSKKVDSSSSSAQSSSSKGKSSSSKKTETSSSKTVASSSSKKVASSSSNKAASSSSKKSGKSSSSSKGKSSVLPAVAFANMDVLFTGDNLVVTAPRSSQVRVQVFDMLGNSRGDFRANVSGSQVFSLQYLQQGRYLIRVNSGKSVQNLNILIK